LDTPLPDTPNHAAALRVFNEHLDLARRMASAIQRRMPPVARRPDTEQIAMGALWETAIKYHDLAPSHFEAMASVRIRGAILDDNRRYDMLPRSNRKRFGGDKLTLVHLDATPEAQFADGYDGTANRANWLAAQFAVVTEPEAGIDAARLSERLEQAVSALTDTRERYIVRATLRGRPHRQIAADLGISQPRASQILKRAVDRLREMLT
jgi:RNA polymerase sigma factor (sigma-70 family)